MQLLDILAVAMVATVLDFLPTVSVNQTVSISKTAVVTSTVHAVSALVGAELGHHTFIFARILVFF